MELLKYAPVFELRETLLGKYGEEEGKLVPLKLDELGLFKGHLEQKSAKSKLRENIVSA
jgi:hypothetical protein